MKARGTSQMDYRKTTSYKRKRNKPSKRKQDIITVSLGRGMNLHYIKGFRPAKKKIRSLPVRKIPF